MFSATSFDYDGIVHEEASKSFDDINLWVADYGNENNTHFVVEKIVCTRRKRV